MAFRSALESKVIETATASRPSIPVLVPKLPGTEELIPFLRRIDANHWYSNYGPLWREFRDTLTLYMSRRTGRPDLRLSFASSGTTAIELALRLRAVAGRRFCLVPSFTFIASAHAICNAGLEPFLLDIDERSLVLTPEIVERALPRLPEAPAAVLVVSAFGAPPNVRAWEAFERTHRIPVVFDAAAALMSLDTVGHQPICVSMHATKVFGIGEGGAVLSTDSGLIDRLTAMTGFGFASGSHASSIRGGNYRISEYAAAIGLAVLATIEQKVARLQSVIRCYASGLRNSRVRLQDGVGEQWATMTLNVLLPPESVKDTLGVLDRAGVEWRRWWGLGCHTHPAFAGVASLPLPATRDLAPRVIGVPCHTELSNEAAQMICRQLVLAHLIHADEAAANDVLA
jgi:dTDP-4-amino-4,6-dideoxygalactose transaminase